MFQQLLVALVLASVTVIFHALGTVFVVLPLAGIWRSNSGKVEAFGSVWALTRLVGLLLIVHLAEMTMWAAAFRLAGIFPEFETSLYFSSTSYTTVGYGDVIPVKTWRLMGPIEATVGVLMLGWSTSIIVAAVQRIYNTRATTKGAP